MTLASVAARNSRITPSVKVRAGEANKCISEFRDGSINVIVATSVIEEVSDLYNVRLPIAAITQMKNVHIYSGL